MRDKFYDVILLPKISGGTETRPFRIEDPNHCERVWRKKVTVYRCNSSSVSPKMVRNLKSTGKIHSL